MSLQLDFLFWKLTSTFIQEGNYRVVSLSESQNELWLENLSQKQAPIIRLLRYNLDWGNWMKKDLDRTVANGERITKKFLKRRVKIVNVYISNHPPLDQLELVERSYMNNQYQKIEVQPILLSDENVSSGIKDLINLIEFNGTIAIPSPLDLFDVQREQKEAINLANHKVKEDRKLFQTANPFFTYMFACIQVLMFFILQLFGGSTNPETLVFFGAKFNPLILEGEWWRFITPIFLHIGFFHLLMNTFALVLIGREVEKIFGKWRFLFIYLLAGIIGCIASFYFNPVGLSAGASGAIFGCFGALLYFGYTFPQVFFRTMGMNILVIVGLNLVLGFTVPGIDNAGHIGGLVGGFIATGIVYFPRKKSVSQLYYVTGTILFLLVSLWIPVISRFF
ncbi:rhomboid family intramembrane serine protease [Bacillus coahuilensis]|uniref:rhomboid family intramembrane serine protease n=1 Tax=Bacillus coahuilensis TaxID=408580 RepID=UPI0001851074|nr:rhomboid family intramembrane serine protease [Bacillus coahuilensis]